MKKPMAKATYPPRRVRAKGSPSSSNAEAMPLPAEPKVFFSREDREVSSRRFVRHGLSLTSCDCCCCCFIVPQMFELRQRIKELEGTLKAERAARQAEKDKEMAELRLYAEGVLAAGAEWTKTTALLPAGSAAGDNPRDSKASKNELRQQLAALNDFPDKMMVVLEENSSLRTRIRSLSLALVAQSGPNAAGGNGGGLSEEVVAAMDGAVAPKPPGAAAGDLRTSGGNQSPEDGEGSSGAQGGAGPGPSGAGSGSSWQYQAEVAQRDAQRWKRIVDAREARIAELKVRMPLPLPLLPCS